MKQQRIRRLMATAVSAVALGLVVSGCAGQSAPDEAANGVEGSTIQVGLLDQLVPQYQTYIDAYEKEYPDRKVEVVQLAGDLKTQVATLNMAGDLPDILFNGSSLVGQFRDGKVTQDVAPLLEEGRGGLKDEFLPAFTDLFRPTDAEQELHALPVSADVTVVFYNRTIFDRYSLPYPEDDWTWKDFNDTAVAITKASNGQVAGARVDGPWASLNQPVIRAAGGYIYDPSKNVTGIAEPEALEAWKVITQANRDGAGGVWGDGTLTMDSGRLGMWIAARPSIATLKASMTDSWDIAPLPTYNGERTTGGGAYGLSITTSANVDAAAGFLGWFFSEEGGMKLAQATGGVVPPTQSGIESGSWREASPPPDSLVRVNEIATSTASTDVVLPGSAQGVYDKEVATAFDEVLINGKSFEEAFGAAAKTINATLSERK